MRIRRGIVSAAMVLIAVVAGLCTLVGPAGAQTSSGSGGGAAYFKQSEILLGRPGWVIESVVIGPDGRPAVGWTVTATGVNSDNMQSGTIKFIQKSPGVYAAKVTTKPGKWTINLSATPPGGASGGSAVTSSFSATFPTASGPGASSSLSWLWIVLAVLAALIIGAVARGFILARRANLPEEVTLVNPDEAAGISLSLVAVINEKLAEAAWKRQALAHLGASTVCIDVYDLETRAFFEMGPTTLNLHSEIGPKPKVTIALHSDWIVKVVEIPEGPLRLPALWKGAGREVTGALLSRSVRVKGLFLHPGISIRMLQLLSVPKVKDEPAGDVGDYDSDSDFSYDDDHESHGSHAESYDDYDSYDEEESHTSHSSARSSHHTDTGTEDSDDEMADLWS